MFMAIYNKYLCMVEWTQEDDYVVQDAWFDNVYLF